MSQKNQPLVTEATSFALTFLGVGLSARETLWNFCPTSWHVWKGGSCREAKPIRKRTNKRAPTVLAGRWAPCVKTKSPLRFLSQKVPTVGFKRKTAWQEHKKKGFRALSYWSCQQLSKAKMSMSKAKDTTLGIAMDYSALGWGCEAMKRREVFFWCLLVLMSFIFFRFFFFSSSVSCCC